MLLPESLKIVTAMDMQEQTGIVEGHLFHNYDM
jgi:hypothetical protein